jgi:N,N'-diacetylchitobiose transport system substrate-binding protein
MNVRHLAAAALVAALAVMAVGATGASGRGSADTLTVWLQEDAKNGWPDIVAAATAQFKSQNPGWEVDIEYKTWNTHLGLFDASLAGGNAPDVIEMGNTEMTKYMAAGAFQDLTGTSFPNQSTWLEGLALSGRYAGKTYGVPYYAGSRVVTYRTDLFRQVGVTRLPTSLAEYSAVAKKLGTKNTAKNFSPVYIAGKDWYVAMSFVADYGGTIAVQNKKGGWVGTLSQPKALAGLAAFKAFFGVASRVSKVIDEARPFPYDVYAQGRAASILGPAWFSCCVGNYKAQTAQFVMPSHTKGQPMPGFLGGSDLAVPIGAEQGQGRRLDPRVHRQHVDDGAPGEGQHPQHDEPARQQRERARRPPELVRPDREALGKRGERQHPQDHAGPHAHEQDDHQGSRRVRGRQHRVHPQPALARARGMELLVE